MPIPHQQLRFGIGAAYAAHVITAGGFAVNVGHGVKVVGDAGVCGSME